MTVIGLLRHVMTAALMDVWELALAMALEFAVNAITSYLVALNVRLMVLVVLSAMEIIIHSGAYQELLQMIFAMPAQAPAPWLTQEAASTAARRYLSVTFAIRTQLSTVVYVATVVTTSSKATKHHKFMINVFHAAD
jgi:hypothetical protein